ncbi:sporulation protein [Herbidospora mongoliensis]|uniref:sporulation protein n=1 Tax=Herbidospora mongoliensis TaxID=688067 RepID=UPI00082FA272|nr:sporulation protein [Herbidospora mongoliensis]
MVFKRMLSAFGVGAPSVDTVLHNPRTQPGGALSGEVRIKGGEVDAEIEHITLTLVARVEIEHSEGESSGLREFFGAPVSGPFTLRKGEDRTIPFQLPVPWETPISEGMRGMAIGVRTELAIAKAVDKGDLDMVEVTPLPSQRYVLEALSRLGFHFRSADLEAGHIGGSRQTLPFYQEIEFTSHQYGEIEVTFISDAHHLEVVIEGGHDAIGRFPTTHDEAVRTDWASVFGNWLSQRSYGGHHGGHGGGHYGRHDDDHHGGVGMGGVVAGAAAGVVGGLILGEVVEEVFEDVFEEE